jgi:hypothetical protein
MMKHLIAIVHWIYLPLRFQLGSTPVLNGERAAERLKNRAGNPRQIPGLKVEFPRNDFGEDFDEDITI